MKVKNLLFGHNSKFIFIACIAFVLFLGIEVKSQDAEIEKIVREVSVDSQKGAIFSYSYLMKVSYDRHKFGGRKFTKLYEAILPSRFTLNRLYSHPLILIQDTEKRITDEQIKIARINIAKEIVRAEKEEDRKLSNTEKPPEDGGYWTMGLSTGGGERVEIDVVKLLKNARLSNLERKQVDGKNVVLLDFAPNPQVVFPRPLSYLSKIEGQIWIDETAKRIVRIEGFPLGAFAALKDKTGVERQKEIVFLFSQMKVSEGFWFPQNVVLNFSKHPEIFESIELEFVFSNYGKGSVEIQYNEDKQKDIGGATSEEKQN